MVDVDLENAETYRLAFKYYEDSLNKLKELMSAIGYEVVLDRGDRRTFSA